MRVNPGHGVMTRISASRGMLYSAPPGEDADEDETAEESADD